MLASLARSLFTRKSERSSSEYVGGSPIQEQEITRYITIGIIFIYLAYLQLSGRIENLVNEPISRVIAGYLIGTLLIQAGIFKKVKDNYLILSALVLDVLVLTIALFILGENSSAFFPVYFWLIVGNGVRYGLRYLRVTAILSLVAFFLVLHFTPYWKENMHLGYGLLVGLAVIPRYLAKLIGQLNQALESATEANKAKSQFMANMSHELRTPLTGIIASADMLKDEKIEGDVRTKVDMISDSANTLMAMIHDVLDVSKVESGRLELAHETAELLPILKNVKSLMAPQAQSKKLDYIVEMDPAMFASARFAPTELQQILINLVGNAIKFTHMGSITVKGKCDDVDGRPGWRFEVSDTGIGMQQDVLATIFDPFVQADTGVTRQYGGTGLGTAICKEFVTLMGGYIGVESKLDQGSSFWFKIPVDYVEEQQTIKPITSARLFSVALIDEEKDNLRSVFGDTLITNLDFNNPDAALQRLKVSKNSVLVSGRDLSAHRFEQISNTLAKQQLGTAPIIRLGQDKGLYRVKFSGNKKTLELSTTKDTSANIISNILTSYLEQPVAAEKLKPVRPLEILVADDAKTNRDILRMMLEKQGHHVTLAEDGLEAMNRLSHSDQNFELVILDRNMPGMDGISVLKTHRVSNNWRQGTEPKFVLLTADASEETRRAALQAGMDSFMTKPLLAKDIHKEILRLFPTLFAEAPTPEGAVNLELAVDNTKPEERHLIDYNVLDNLGNMSPEGAIFVKRMVDSFLGDAKKMVAELNSGFTDQDYGQALEAAHALKGSALQIGAPVLADYCDSLRKIARIDFTAEKCQQLTTELNTSYEKTLAEFTQYLKELEASEDHSFSSTPQ